MMHNNMYYSQSNGAQESCYDYDYYNSTDPYSYNGFNSTSSSNSSYVDCTLSLGTPSTRSETGVESTKKQSSKRSGSKVSNFCWDLLQQTTSSSSKNVQNGSYSKGGRVSGGGAGGGDPLVSRRCANCDTTSTPLWRNGPKGPKSLCNACGIRYKKEERRASAAASATSNGSSAMESQYASSEHYYSNQSYTHHHHQQAQKMNCLFPAAANEYRYMEAADDNSHYEHPGNGAVSFLPWMLNVADRPSLVHDFTR
ncbi:hypothetical protein QQ045_026899 [Rhodiola kirilowii]